MHNCKIVHGSHPAPEPVLHALWPADVTLLLGTVCSTDAHLVNPQRLTVVVITGIRINIFRSLFTKLQCLKH